jgi:lysophospholipase L1-like esterase
MIACRQVAAAALLLALGACSSGSDDPASDRDPATTAPPSASASVPATTATYVALGDSFTAGPGITRQQPDSGFCQRSTRNWPALLAAEVDLPVTDVSCSGATTADLVETVASDVLDQSPRLVTVSSGGNDGGLFTSLLQACAGGGSSCSDYVTGQVPGILQKTTADLAALLGDVASAVPDAQVVLVGYPRIAPETGSCAAIGISDTAPVVAAETALDAALADAGRRAGVTYVSLRDDSTGHDACAGADAWTNGISAPSGDGIIFHPNARGMQAVADLVGQAVERSAG